jgi:D-glycero-D-manno-heptose 1,7-bisphosphate phosphatase
MAGKGMSVRRAVFLDRDGVINRKVPEGQYVTSWEQVEFLPGVAEALGELKQDGFLLIIATNQSAVSRKKLSLEGLESIHRRMLERLAKEGADLDAVYYCPHEQNADCPCRKPKPGMLRRAAEEHGIDLLQSWMIGDAASDIEAGRAAGCRTVWLRPENFEGASPPPAEFGANSLREAARVILSAGPAPEGSPDGKDPLSFSMQLGRRGAR